MVLLQCIADGARAASAIGLAETFVPPHTAYNIFKCTGKLLKELTLDPNSNYQPQ